MNDWLVRIYVAGLTVIAGLIVAPGAIARLSGAHIDLMAPIAGYQLFAIMAFWLTLPLSFVLFLFAMVKLKMVNAILLAGAMTLPFATWFFSVLFNEPGWQAVMGV